MAFYFMTCRSLTYAQRTVKVLERGGVSCYMARTPKHLAREGCGHGVKVGEQSVQKALQLLNQADLSPRKLYYSLDGRDYQEVSL